MKRTARNYLLITVIFTWFLVDVKAGKITSEKRSLKSGHENNFPEFKSCSRYNPRIKEEQPTGTPVITVLANDPDPREDGGTITYELIDSTEQSKFHINKNTGEITTKSIFNRDEPDREKEFKLIVRAMDSGNPQLQDICLFTVTIEDINDNPPVFERNIYKEFVSMDKEINSEVMLISATDIDDGLNREVHYALNASAEDYDFFKVDKKTGKVRLVKAITKPVGYVFKIQALAFDKNPIEPKSSAVDLEITVIESKKSAPEFDTNLSGKVIELYENFTSITENIATFKAKLKPDEQAPVFTLFTGISEDTNSRDTFVLSTNSKKDTAYIRLSGNVRLDYEVVKEYTLTVRVENKYSLATTQSFKIKILDLNDIAPRFEKRAITGQVYENERPGTLVTKVQAIDDDETPEFKKITYELGDSTDLFEIDSQSGIITTKKEFDRETEESYNVKVIAKDGVPSALSMNGEPNTVEQVFRFHIADKNDNSPKFEKDKYTTEISANTAVNSLLLEVKATDVDSASRIDYSIVGGNENGVFEIVPGAGTGIIKTKTKLDQGNKTLYLLEVAADDGLFKSKCLVEIKVANVNKHDPQFIDQRLGIVIEENLSISECLLTVEAYDPDLDRHEDQRIVYSLWYPYQDEFFKIHANGCLSLVKPLNRIRPYEEPWHVLIKANDNGGNPSTTRFTIAEIEVRLREQNCPHPPCVPQTSPPLSKSRRRPVPTSTPPPDLSQHCPQPPCHQQPCPSPPCPPSTLKPIATTLSSISQESR